MSPLACRTAGNDDHRPAAGRMVGRARGRFDRVRAAARVDPASPRRCRGGSGGARASGGKPRTRVHAVADGGCEVAPIAEGRCEVASIAEGGGFELVGCGDRDRVGAWSVDYRGICRRYCVDRRGAERKRPHTERARCIQHRAAEQFYRKPASGRHRPVGARERAVPNEAGQRCGDEPSARPTQPNSIR